jgi:hypothetical protein
MYSNGVSGPSWKRFTNLDYHMYAHTRHSPFLLLFVKFLNSKNFGVMDRVSSDIELLNKVH